MIESGAEVNTVDNEGRTLLHRAAQADSDKAFGMLQALFQVGADARILDHGGRSALRAAIIWRNVGVAAVLETYVDHRTDDAALDETVKIWSERLANGYIGIDRPKKLREIASRHSNNACIQFMLCKSYHQQDEET